MKIDPFLPLWLMAPICIGLLFLKRKGIVPFIRQIVIVLLLFAINLHILIPDEEHVVKTPKIDAYVLFVMDNTLSMLAEDMPEDDNRLAAAKEDCGYIIDKLNGAKFGVVSFDHKAKIVSPYTDNPDHIKSMLKTVYPVEQSYAEGSSFNLCQDLIEEQVKVAREKEETNVFVFFISDGENNKDDKIKSYSKIGKNIDGGAVLGYGTSKGAEMTIQAKTAGGLRDEKVKDSKGKNAKSKIDEKNLKNIAEDLKVDYINMKDSSDVDGVIDQILENVQVTEEEMTEFSYIETYYFFLPPLVLLLLWDFIYFKRKV